MTVVVRRPRQPLTGLVAAIVYRTGEQSRTSVEKILPVPETGLWVNLNRDAFRSWDVFGEAGRVHQMPGAMVAGPTGRASVIEFEEGHAHVSVAFALGAAPCFLTPSLAVLRDELVPLDAVCGGAGAFLRERLLEAPGPEDALTLMEDFLIGQMADDAHPDPAVVAAAGALGRGSRVAEVADRLGLLPRTLRRRFTAQVGLTPKRFGRVQRLQRLVRGLDGQIRVDWAATAARYGYCDQAHLTGEFRELVGVTPAGYLRSRVNGPNHLRFDVRA